jgi:hypothetical protein
MSARFGRNQKRRLKAEIASLRSDITIKSAALQYATSFIYEPATGKWQSLTSFGYVVEQVITDEQSYRQCSRRAIVILKVSAEQMKRFEYLISYRGYVEWEGVVWEVREPFRMGKFLWRSVNEPRSDAQIEVELAAVGVMTPEKRANLSGPFDMKVSMVRKDALWPEDLSPSYLESLRRETHPDTFRDLYENKPVPPVGRSDPAHPYPMERARPHRTERFGLMGNPRW